MLRRAKEKILFRKWSKRSRASSSKQWPIGIVASGPCREDWAPLKMAPQLSVKIGPLAPARSIPLPSNLFWEQPPVDFAAFLHDYYCVTRSPKTESQQWARADRVFPLLSETLFGGTSFFPRIILSLYNCIFSFFQLKSKIFSLPLKCYRTLCLKINT